jgi:hypothetical protein
MTGIQSEMIGHTRLPYVQAEPATADLAGVLLMDIPRSVPRSAKTEEVTMPS